MRRCVHPPPVHPHSPATPGARAAFARPAPHHLCCTVPIARVSLQVKELPLWLTKELAPRNYIEYRTPHVFQPQQLSKLKAGPHQLRQPGLRVAHSARKYSHAAKVTLARVLVHPAVAPPHQQNLPPRGDPRDAQALLLSRSESGTSTSTTLG